MVASATDRARHAGTRPACTWAHRRGRRWRSSRACPMSRFAETVEMPRTAPSSATQNSATVGTALTGDGLLHLEPDATAGGEGRGVVDRLGRVEVGPPGGDVQHVGGGAVFGGLACTSSASSPEASRSSSTSASGSHCQRLDHVFDSMTSHRQWPMHGTLRNSQEPRGPCSGFEARFARTSTTERCARTSTTERGARTQPPKGGHSAKPGSDSSRISWKGTVAPSWLSSPMPPSQVRWMSR